MAVQMKTDCTNEIAEFHIYSFAIIPDQICFIYEKSHYFSTHCLGRFYLEFRNQAMSFAPVLSKTSRKQVNKKLSKRNCGGRKWGFHGTSCSSFFGNVDVSDENVLDSPDMPCKLLLIFWGLKTLKQKMKNDIHKGCH